jgi:hypothetical protein
VQLRYQFLARCRLVCTVYGVVYRQPTIILHCTIATLYWLGAARANRTCWYARRCAWTTYRRSLVFR